MNWKCEIISIFASKCKIIMLIRFSVENFMSFKDRQTFSMIAGKGGRNKSYHVIKKEKKNDVNLVKAAVIFGANASGKSNFIKAVDFGQKLVLTGTKPENKIDFQNFRLHSDSLNSPSRIEYEIKHKGKSYAYGFVFTSKIIIEEWLYSINRKGESIIFERSNTSRFNLDTLNKLNSNEGERQFISFIAKGTPDNQLFLNEIRNRKTKDNVSNIEDILNVIDWFQNALTIVYPQSRNEGIEFELENNHELSTIFEEVLKYFDTGIDGISLRHVDFEKMDLPLKLKENIKSTLLNEKSEKTNAIVSNIEKNIRYIISKESKDKISVRKLMLKHNIQGVGNEDYFDINEESDGTQRIMDLIPMFIDLFKGGNVYLIDEMERSLHPNLIYDIISLFLESSLNSKSQLILASHETSILTQNLLRKDEIWFTVKDEFGASSIYSLEEFDIRFDKQLRKDYLLGRFNAIPRFGNRKSLSFIK